MTQPDADSFAMRFLRGAAWRLPILLLTAWALALNLFHGPL